MTSRLSNWQSVILNNCARIVQRLWPQQCLLCTAAVVATPVCKDCYLHLPWLAQAHCPQCALPTATGNVCGACLSHPPRFDSVCAAFAYVWPLAPLIHQYKYAGNLVLAQFFGRVLAQSAAKHQVDLLIPMPLAPTRLRSRGFNQALEVARVLSKLTGVALAANACRRVRDSTPQAMLPWNERVRNIRGAFVCDADLRGKRVAVVDDVMTTGATLNELARNLRQAGAAEIQGWVVARTLPR